MTVTRLRVLNAGKPDISNHDRIMTALNQAIEDQKIDDQGKQSARGIAIIWLRDYPDGAFGESWIIEGMNTLEAIGLLKIAGDDLSQFGLDGAPDHFPGGRPKPTEPA